MQPIRRLLALLADGELHSGSELAAEMGVSRTAVWKHMAQLESIGVTVDARAGKGYRLHAPLELLDAERISDAMTPTTLRLCRRPQLLWDTPSTSDYLLDGVAPEIGQAHVVFAEHQSEGRGRRCRTWLARVGDTLCFSVGWSLATAPDNLGCLGLATGVAVMRALRRGGVRDITLKWPNDVLLGDAKLAGILIDVRGEAGGPLHVVAGVGLNYRVDHATTEAVRAAGGVAPASLAQYQDALGRNTLAGMLADEVVLALREFSNRGFAPFAGEWQDADYLRGKAVTVVSQSAEGNASHGVARGISPDGQLKLDVDGAVQMLSSGDISVRPDAEGARA